MSTDGSTREQQWNSSFFLVCVACTHAREFGTQTLRRRDWRTIMHSGVARWVMHLVLHQSAGLGFNITNNGLSLNAGLYRDPSDEILGDLTSQIYDKIRRYRDQMYWWCLYGWSLRGFLNIYAGWTRLVAHIAPQCLNTSYSKSQFGFRIFLDLDRQQFLYQWNVIVRQ